MTIRQRHKKSRALARLVPSLTKTAFAERGFHHQSILTDWQKIVGADLSTKCAAMELKADGTLVIRADSSSATALQHMEPQVLERIATYFGFRAVKRLAIRHGTIPVPEAIDSPAQPAEPSAALKSHLSDVPDPALHGALLRLGARIEAIDDET